MQQFEDVISGAQQIAGSTNYNPAMAQRVASLSPYQMQGFAGIADMQGRYDPYMSQALGTAGNVSQGIGASDINKFMSPYTQNVIDTTMAQARQQQGAQLENVVGNQIAQNAQGGNRAMLQKALTEGQFALANNQTIAGLEQAGYGQAVQTALANNAQQLQGAYGLGNLAQSGQGMDMAQLSALIGAGAAQQGQTQAEYNAATANATQQTMWPLQMQQWLAGIVGGIGALEGGTTGGESKTTQNPGVLQWLGAIGAGAASMSDERLKENKKVIGETFDGQPIYSYNFKGERQTHLGLLAQDVEKRHPEAVGEYNGWKTVDYDVATEDAAERGRLNGRKNFANGGFADGGDPWASLLGKQQSFQSPNVPNVIQPATGPIGGDTEQYRKQGEQTGKNLKQGYENYQKYFGKGSPGSGTPGTGADSSAGMDSPDMGGAPAGGGGGGGPKIPGMEGGPGGMKMPGGMGGMGPGSGSKAASAPAGTTGSGPNAIQSTGWQSFLDTTVGAPGSASTAAANESAAALSSGPTADALAGGASSDALIGGAGLDSLAAAGEAATAASGAGAAAGAGAAGAGEAAAGVGSAAAGAGEAAAAAGAGAGAAAEGGAEGLGGIFSLLALLKRGGSVDTKYSKHLRSLKGHKSEHHAKALFELMHERNRADGGETSLPDNIWDVTPHDERFLWNPYAFKPLPSGGVDPRAAYDTMHMNDLPPIAGMAKPSAPEPQGEALPMARPQAPAPEPQGEALPMARGLTVAPETLRWTANQPEPRAAEYGAQSMRAMPSVFGHTPTPEEVRAVGQRQINEAVGPVVDYAGQALRGAAQATGEFNTNLRAALKPDKAPTPDEIMAEGQRQINDASKPAIEYVRGVFNGSTQATGEFATNVWDAIKSTIPKGDSLTPEEAAALRKEIADRPGALEKMWPGIQRTMQGTAAAYQAAKESAAALPGAVSGMAPKFLTAEEAAAERARRMDRAIFPTHEQLVGDQPVTNQPGYLQSSYEHLARMPGDIGAAAQRSLVEPVKEFAGDVYNAAGELPGVISGAGTALARRFAPERANEPTVAKAPPTDEKTLGRTLYERVFPNLSGVERVNEPAGAPPETAAPAPAGAAAPTPSDAAFTPVKTFRVDPGVPPEQQQYPMMEPYTAGLPAPKASAPEEAGPGGAPVPMTARLNLEGNLGSVARDKDGTPSMGRFGINAVANENASSAANFYHDHGEELGFRANPVEDPWGFAREWQRIAKENSEGLMKAENAWYNKYVSGAAPAHLIHAGVPRSVAEDPRVKDYMGDRLIQHGSGITPYSTRKYQDAWSKVSPEDPDKAGTFLTKLTGLDKAATAHDFRGYLSDFSGAEYDRRLKALENRVTNRLKGAMGDVTATQATPERSEAARQGFKSAAELLPEDRKQVGFIQKILGGWNPLEPITGPGPNGPGTDLLGLSPDQRRNLMQFSLGLMQGPFMGQSAAGAGQAMQHINQYGLEQAKLGLEAMKAPKFQAFHTVDPMTGAQTTSLFNVHTGQIVGPQGMTPGAAPAAVSGSPIPAGVHGQEALNAVPEQYRSELESVVSGETPITTYRSGPQREMWMRLARQVDPEWSERKAILRQKFREGIVNQTTTEGKLAHSFNTATGHLNDSLSLNEVLPDNSATVATVRGWWNDKFGNDPYRAAWKTMALGLADEVAKIQGGGSGSEAERLRWLERFSPDLPRSVRSANLASAVRIMTSHLNDMDRTYRGVMGGFSNPYDFLGQEGRNTIRRAEEKFSQHAGGKPIIPAESQGAAQAPAQAAPQAAAPMQIDAGPKPLRSMDAERADLMNAIRAAKVSGREDMIPAIIERAHKRGVELGAQ
jgi:hypothetical protein